MTLDDYNKQILEPAIKRFASCAAYEAILRKNMIEDASFYGYVPTRWQRLKYRMKDYRQRIKDIWAILRGKDIHEDCER